MREEGCSSASKTAHALPALRTIAPLGQRAVAVDRQRVGLQA